MPFLLPRPRWALTPPFHHRRKSVGQGPTLRQSLLCGAFPGVAPAGRYPAPFLHGVRTFLGFPRGHPAIRATGGLCQHRVLVNRQTVGKGGIPSVQIAPRPRSKPQSKGRQQGLLGGVRIAQRGQGGPKGGGIHGRCGLGPNRQALPRQTLPIKAGARIGFAGWGHVGMGDDAVRGNIPARHHVPQ